jgi:hypothetical protein
MNRLIINNESSLSDSEVLEVIASVISQGRISDDGLSYCYLTILVRGDKEYGVRATLNKVSDSFTVWERIV